MTESRKDRTNRTEEPMRKIRYRIKNGKRFATVLAAGALILIACVFGLSGRTVSNGSVQMGGTTAPPATATASPTPSPTVSPTNTPDPVPVGKREVPALVVIDPGHGGRDPGAVSLDGQDVRESDIVLEIGLMVRDLIEEKGVPVLMTRTEDIHFAESVNPDLLARSRIANEADASLFACIHVNSFDTTVSGGSDVNGMEMYYRDGRVSLYDGFDSAEYAQLMLESIAGANGMKYAEKRERSLSVLRETMMPAVLIETAYITNPVDCRKLEDPDFLQRTAKGIADGIEAALERIGMFEREGKAYVYKNVDTP